LLHRRRRTCWRTCWTATVWGQPVISSEVNKAEKAQAPHSHSRFCLLLEWGNIYFLILFIYLIYAYFVYYYTYFIACLGGLPAAAPVQP
jgi:hypothetical protein